MDFRTSHLYKLLYSDTKRYDSMILDNSAGEICITGSRSRVESTGAVSEISCEIPEISTGERLYELMVMSLPVGNGEIRLAVAGSSQVRLRRDGRINIGISFSVGLRRLCYQLPPLLSLPFPPDARVHTSRLLLSPAANAVVE
jgi:hypothetical protein